MRILTLFEVTQRKNEMIVKMNISVFKYVQTVGTFPDFFQTAYFLGKFRKRTRGRSLFLRLLRIL